ncbi:hypothetical protein GCM10009854_13920 [Saccharopolyspora halophila]|uniref:Alcohol dehydrogenase-like N-terminal domain-containing protein n=1 Tax=Saccharopolyspora halophila TaxID=405551 RepID=A0ABN3FW36_9PSEU
MKAVVYQEPFSVAVDQVDRPTIEHPNDVIVRVTSTAICGSDLHMYEGRTAAEPGIVFGHENMGLIEDVGAGVTGLARGDRVVMPFNVACGFCKNCVAGDTAFCLTVNPGLPVALTATCRWGLTRVGRPSTCACRTRTSTA